MRVIQGRQNLRLGRQSIGENHPREETERDARIGDFLLVTSVSRPTSITTVHLLDEER